MWVVRPVALQDLAAIRELAADQGARISSTLPREESQLEARAKESLAAFAGDAGQPGQERFLFVLEDTVTGQLLGTAGIDVCAGNGQPFYNYRQDALIHASHELGVSNRVEVLYPSHALTGRTLLCSFMIAADARQTDAFELLSRTRLLFVARHRHRFADDMVVEIQGVQGEDGQVPFWDSLGRHFFNMDFNTADHYSGALSKTFIAELMPPNPIYVTLLTEAARAALGKPNEVAARTFDLLQREGFYRDCYLDIFDGGPVLEARTDRLKTVVSSHHKVARAGDVHDGSQYLVSAGEGSQFRATLTSFDEGLGESVRLPLPVLQLLGAATGDELLVAAL